FGGADGQAALAREIGATDQEVVVVGDVHVSVDPLGFAGTCVCGISFYAGFVDANHVVVATQPKIDMPWHVNHMPDVGVVFFQRRRGLFSKLWRVLLNRMNIEVKGTGVLRVKI